MMKPTNRACKVPRKGQWTAPIRGALGVILALVMALLFTPAQAQTPPDRACVGKNLLPELQQRDPKAYGRVAAEAAETPNGQAIFWKIEKPGLKPSYLLGTMHVTDPRVLTMPKGAQDAAKGADTIIVESDEVLDDKKAAIALMAKPELSMFTDGSTITSHLTPEQVKELEAGLKKRGLALSAVNRMKPWIIASFVALPACELARKAEGTSFLDKRIAQDAANAGKRVVGLETYAEQLEALNDLPMAFHLKSLIDTLQLGDTMNDVNETMIDLYLKGDIGAIMPLLQAISPDPASAKDADYAAFEQRIVLDRNKIMAERAAPTLNQGNVFMAVGALHLPGEGGVVALLRQQGFTVTAMP
ncbi:polysaccharide biosynthesis protein GumN [Rhizobium oryziradicis]|uniref:Polysaccharide biosynthesis protein GumN n=2 Tax=Rhizobium oryziradicis TaxID=1867956 RepID=A0A1Q8ZLM4_9HYPH|nr:polysaccharide biosynthesis protein GumN [Rhizobium oryziradicis]